MWTVGRWAAGVESARRQWKREMLLDLEHIAGSADAAHERITATEFEQGQRCIAVVPAHVWDIVGEGDELQRRVAPAGLLIHELEVIDGVLHELAKRRPG